MTRVPFHKPALSDEEEKAAVEVIRSGWLTVGPKTREFESSFGAEVGATHAVALNSGTAALHLAVVAGGVGPGDEVIVPTMTFAATAAVVIHAGATPVFVDSRPDTFNIDTSLIERAITDKTKAIIPVHYGGQPCDMDEITELAKAHDLMVIEDAAHAFPASYKERPIGSISDATCFSFYANKTMTMGEGGCLTTEDDELADLTRILSVHGLSRDAWKRYRAGGSALYDIIHAGFKYNLTDIAASIGLAQLAKAYGMREQRKRIAARYSAAFTGVSAVEPLAVQNDRESSWHLYVVQLDLDQMTIDRDDFVALFTEAEIGSSIHWKPLHMHSFYRDTFGLERDAFPVAAAAFDRIVSLPIYPDMTDDEVDTVIGVVADIVAKHQR